MRIKNEDRMNYRQGITKGLSIEVMEALALEEQQESKPKEKDNSEEE